MTTLLESITNAIKHWYIPLILGLLFVALGIYVFTVPLETYVTLAVLFSVSFIVTGLFEIFFAAQNSKAITGWGWYLVGGILTLALGIYLVVYPEVSASVLPFVVGFTLLFRSSLLLGFAFDLKSANVLSWGNVALTAVLGIILSFMLLASPLFTGLSLVTLTALTFIFVGIASIMLALNLKKAKDAPAKISNELKDKIQSLQNEISNAMKAK